MSRRHNAHSDVSRIYADMESTALPNGQQPFHPPFLPSALPPLASFSSAESPARIHTQRTLGQIDAHHRWLSLLHDLQQHGLARDAPRLISYSQPGATSSLSAIPKLRQFSVSSPRMLVACQRLLGLRLSCLSGLPAHSAILSNAPAIDPFGDLYVNRAAEHTGRHNGALDAWTDCLKRAFRSPCRVVPNPEHYYGISGDAKPDALVKNALNRDRHYVIENKVLAFLDSSSMPKHPDAAHAAFAATAPPILASIASHYSTAHAKGHKTIPLIHEVSGAVHPTALKLLGEATRRMNGRRLNTHDVPDAPWSAPTLRPFLLQSLSVAIHTHVAGQILDRACEESSRAHQAA